MNTIARMGFAALLMPLAACNSNPATPLASTVPAPQTVPTISAQDQKFLDQAASSNIFEIRSAELALQRSRSADTRRFAQMLLADHQAVGDKLAGYAKENGVVLPTGMGPEEERAYAAINNTRRIFDSEFYRQQALAHQTAISVYETERDSGYNQPLKMFAIETLPILRQHLNAAQSGRQGSLIGTPARTPAIEQ